MLREKHIFGCCSLELDRVFDTNAKLVGIVLTWHEIQSKIRLSTWCVNFFLSLFCSAFLTLHYTFWLFSLEDSFISTTSYWVHSKWESNQPQKKTKKMGSKRRKISKLSLSIFSSGQFININLFCFVVIFFFFFLL